MKTIEEIKSKIAEIDSKRILSIADRSNAETDAGHDVAHNCVLAYAMQQVILEWVLSE